MSDASFWEDFGGALLEFFLLLSSCIVVKLRHYRLPVLPYLSAFAVQVDEHLRPL